MYQNIQNKKGASSIGLPMGGKDREHGARNVKNSQSPHSMTQGVPLTIPEKGGRRTGGHQL